MLRSQVILSMALMILVRTIAMLYKLLLLCSALVLYICSLEAGTRAYP
jgi:hypothetical protein